MTAITALSTLTTDLTTLSTSAASYVSHAAPAAASFAAHGPHDGDGPGWWVLFPIAWLLVVVTVITFVFATARRRGRQWGRRAGEGRLAERYANGEIDEQEYRARLATLRQLGEG